MSYTMTCNEPDTVPMIRVTKPSYTASDSVPLELYFCVKCGCNFSTGTCPSHGRDFPLKK